MWTVCGVVVWYAGGCYTRMETRDSLHCLVSLSVRKVVGVSGEYSRQIEKVLKE